MNRTSQQAATARSTRKPRGSHGVQGGSSEANRLAVAILEVLAGVLSPTAAAQALGISLPRYYQLETRALEGLVAACQLKPKGKQPSLERKVEALEQQLERAHRECARHLALARVAQRSVGLGKLPADGKTSQHNGTARKKRRPAVRALKAAQALRKNIRTDEQGALETTEGEGSSNTAGTAAKELANKDRQG